MVIRRFVSEFCWLADDGFAVQRGNHQDIYSSVLSLRREVRVHDWILPPRNVVEDLRIVITPLANVLSINRESRL